jgi:hypothetical protein
MKYKLIDETVMTLCLELVLIGCLELFGVLSFVSCAIVILIGGFQICRTIKKNVI